MAWNFEEFTGRFQRSPQVARVSLTTGGAVLLNDKAWRLLGQPQRVALLFDKEQQVVGLRPAREGIRGFLVRKQQGSKSYIISGMGFCRYYGIDLSMTKAFEPILEDGILVFMLNEGIAVESRRGKRKDAA